MNRSNLGIETGARAAALALLAGAAAQCTAALLVAEKVREALINKGVPEWVDVILYRPPVVQCAPLLLAVIVAVISYRCKSMAITFALIGLGVLVQAISCGLLLFAYTIPFWIIRDYVPGG